MKIRNIVIAAIVISVLAVILAVIILRTENKTSEIKNYNVLVIVSDALRFDVIGCYGGTAKTPNIDWIAQEGTLFESAYSPSPWTVPSSVAMLTANYPSTYPAEIKDDRYIRFIIPNEEELFGEILKTNGYDMRMHVENPLASNSNNFQGFDSLRLFNQLNDAEKLLIQERTNIINRSKAYENMFGILEYLLNFSKENNFFALKWILDPHSFYDPPQEFLTTPPFPQNRLPKSAEFYSSFHFYEGYQDIPNRVNGNKLNEIEINYVKYLYEKEVESMDERVGYILNALRANDLLSNTLLVFTSDHGQAFRDHGQYGHSLSYYEELLHVPLLMSGPEIPKGKRVETPVSILGMIPTIIDFLGYETLEDIQGVSFKKLLEGKEKKDSSFYFIGAQLIAKYEDAMLENSYKLITHRDKKKFELYNIMVDPKEVYDISESNLDLVRDMLKNIESIRKKNGQKKAENLARLDGSDKMNSQTKEKILEQLKALGYIH